MKQPFNKKRFWLIIVILAVIETIILGFVIRRKYIVPRDEVSELYTRYENVEGIDVSFIKDFRVNDTVFVDVTLLEAKDSNGWKKLCEDFYIPQLDPRSQRKINEGKEMLFSRLINKKTLLPSNEYNEDEDAIRSISFIKKKICIFHIKNDSEVHALFYHIFDKSVNNTKNKKR